jgi:hypothetical protein
MKKTIALLIMVVALVAIVPAASAGRGTVGEQINLLPECGSEIHFDADTAFHVIHGWGGIPPGFWDFRLYIDGTQIRGGQRFVTVESTRPYTRNVRMAYNFPGGMPEGTYSFTGEWLLREKSEMTVFTCTHTVIFD